MSDIEKVKKLRQLSGAGFKDCNSTLKETNGDIEKALELLRVKGISKASKKMSRSANEGVVAVSGNDTKTSIIEVNCETDFVAKNDDFINFVKEISKLNNDLNSNINKLNEAKLENGKTVQDSLVDLIAKIGEKITIGRAKTISNDGCKNYVYKHSVVKDNLSKLAVITCLKISEKDEKVDSIGKQLSMHIAASNPIALTHEKIEQSVIEKEQELILEELKNSGKSEEITKKIGIGKLKKFKEENSLLSQQWVMDPKKKVKDVLKELNMANLEIKDYYRIKIGE